MPNKNRIIQILQMAIGITKFSLLITFYLDWGIILVRHRRASMNTWSFNQLMASDCQQQILVKKFSLTSSTEVINTSWNNYISLNIKANNQFQFEIQYIYNSLIQLLFHNL
jgi:hypothetical protein